MKLKIGHGRIKGCTENFVTENMSLVLMIYPTQNSTPFVNPLVLGAFATFRKATISFVMSVRLVVRVEKFGSHWADFHEI
jgi:hypothetical protein